MLYKTQEERSSTQNFLKNDLRLQTPLYTTTGWTIQTTDNKHNRQHTILTGSTIIQGNGKSRNADLIHKYTMVHNTHTLSYTDLLKIPTPAHEIDPVIISALNHIIGSQHYHSAQPYNPYIKATLPTHLSYYNPPQSTHSILCPSTHPNSHPNTTPNDYHHTGRLPPQPQPSTTTTHHPSQHNPEYPQTILARKTTHQSS